MKILPDDRFDIRIIHYSLIYLMIQINLANIYLEHFQNRY